VVSLIFVLKNFSRICNLKWKQNVLLRIPHQCETNRPPSEGRNICASITRWTPRWWLSDGCGEVTDSHVWSLCWVLGVLIADVSKNEPQNTWIYNGDAVGPPNLVYQIVMLLRRDRITLETILSVTVFMFAWFQASAAM